MLSGALKLCCFYLNSRLCGTVTPRTAPKTGCSSKRAETSTQKAPARPLTKRSLQQATAVGRIMARGARWTGLWANSKSSPQRSAACRAKPLAGKQNCCLLFSFIFISETVQHNHTTQTSSVTALLHFFCSGLLQRWTVRSCPGSSPVSMRSSPCCSSPLVYPPSLRSAHGLIFVFPSTPHISG